MAKEWKLLAGGKWSAGERSEPVTNPFDGAALGTVAVAGKEDLERATVAAQRAFESFRKTSRAERHRLIRAVQQKIREHRDELAALIVADAGKPLTQARGEVDRALMTFELASHEVFRAGGEVLPVDIQEKTADYSLTVERFPIGPVAGITPFNFPLNLLAHKVAPVLAIGSAIVVKVPPQAPLTALRLGELLQEAGVPDGVYNAMHMPVELAESMVKDERFKFLSFTGSAKVGWHLKAAAGKKKVLLELGGNAGVLVHEDADLDWAADRVVFGSYAYAGQVCIKVQRCFVHRPVYEAFVEKLVERTKKVKAGDPSDEATVAGPIIDKPSFERILQWIDEAKVGGAKVLAGGGGDYPVVEPTLLESGDASLKVNCAEIFGPVTTIAPYDEWTDGIAALNDSAYGLQAGVFTHDIRRIREAFRELEVGGVVANDVPTLRVDNYPYGGVKDSGLGREGVKYSVEEMTEPRVLLLHEKK